MRTILDYSPIKQYLQILFLYWAIRNLGRLKSSEPIVVKMSQSQTSSTHQQLLYIKRKYRYDARPRATNLSKMESQNRYELIEQKNWIF